MPNHLSISWLMKFPYVSPKRWHTWKEIDLNKTLESAQQLEVNLGWPLGTIKVLEVAFEKKLSRFEGWKLPYTDNTNSEAFKVAAQVYKRGVPLKTDGNNLPTSITSGTYSIEIPPHNHPISSLLEFTNRSPETFVVIDQKVSSHWNLEQYIKTPYIISLSELSKNLNSVALIVEEWKKRGKPLNWIIIGGGVLTDTAAFAAYLCESKFTLIPTTLLSIADASVGGKTGVNMPPYGKNQLGAFAFPQKVITWSGWLNTLDQRHIISGASECFKHGFLSNNKNLIERTTHALQSSNKANFNEILHDTIKIKASVITKDPAEKGLRTILNLGHTLAHALEGVSHKAHCSKESTIIMHGEAVNIGLLFAAILSNNQASLPNDQMNFIIDTLKRSNCLVPKEQLALYLGVKKITDESTWKKISSYFKLDKKYEKKQNSSTSRWVLLNKLGEPAISSDGSYTISVDNNTLNDCWSSTLAHLP